MASITRITVEPKDVRLARIQTIIETALHKEFGPGWEVQHAALARILTEAIDAATSDLQDQISNLDAATSDLQDQISNLDDRLNTLETRPMTTIPAKK